jgi:myo-inositol-1(or 4)-monophosphatase
MSMGFGYSERHAVAPDDAARFLKFAVATAAEAGAAALPYFRTDVAVENKRADGGFDPVTEADRGAERVIRRAIQAKFPGHGLCGEEYGYEPGNGLTWVIDPIDGTRAFTTGMLHWGVLLALFDGETPVVGVMHQPFTGEFFCGDGRTAEYRRGDQARALRVRACESIDQAVLASTSPQFFRPEGERAAFDRVRAHVRTTRYGGDCYLYCMLAMGYVDIAVEAGLHPYDIQALMPIIAGAGGVVSSWTGGNASMGGTVVAAGDARVHAEAIQLLGAA